MFPTIFCIRYLPYINITFWSSVHSGGSGSFFQDPDPGFFFRPDPNSDPDPDPDPDQKNPEFLEAKFNFIPTFSVANKELPVLFLWVFLTNFDDK